MPTLSHLDLALAALLLEAAIGYSAFLYRAIGHPVTWMGALLSWLDRWLNGPRAPNRQRRMRGVIALALLLAVTIGCAVALDRLALVGPLSGALTIVAASSLLAQRSLHEHVSAVAEALERDGLMAGRRAVSRIVGRNPETLDEAGVARAAIESLAENFSDGIIAPAFWLAIGGLPAGACYKAINTADSMIGHRTPRHELFGWAAARLDDAVNLPASRLAALCLVLAAQPVGASPRGAWQAVWRDARKHRSPNAGWPEAAMAGALGLQLAGPRVYGDTLVEDALMGHGRRAATAADIRRALRLYRVACLVLWLALLAIILIVHV